MIKKYHEFLGDPQSGGFLRDAETPTRAILALGITAALGLGLILLIAGGCG